MTVGGAAGERQSLAEAGDQCCPLRGQALDVEVERDLPRHLPFLRGCATELGNLAFDLDAPPNGQPLSRSALTRWRLARTACQQGCAEAGQHVDQALDKGEEVGAGQLCQCQRLHQTAYRDWGVCGPVDAGLVRRAVQDDLAGFVLCPPNVPDRQGSARRLLQHQQHR